MRIKRITHITSFSTTGEMYDAIKRVSHELGVGASDLIREAIQEYLRMRSLDSEIGEEGSKNKEGDGDGLL